MRCDAELCPNWTGQGCICDAADLPRQEFRCSNCYESAFGDGWCDSCDSWPCRPGTCGNLHC